jgi:hypothetical protein
VLGRVDELVVLKCLAGLLVHWVESSFGLCMAGPHRGIAREGFLARKFQFISRGGDYGRSPVSCSRFFAQMARFSGRLPAKG